MKDRIYTKEEVAALLERTSDLQRQVNTTAPDRQGLTLEELETIASDAGLEPDLLRQAVAELDDPHESLADMRAGSSATHVFAERWVAGRVTAGMWKDIVTELRYVYESDYGLGKTHATPDTGDGVTFAAGRTAEWRHTSFPGVETRLTLKQTEDNVRLRLSQRVGWATAGLESLVYTAIPGFLAALIAGAITGSLVWGLIALLATMAVLAPLVALVDNRSRRKKRRELEELGDRLAMKVREHSDQQPAELRAASGDVQNPREPVSLPADEDLADERGAQRQRNRT